MANTSAPNVITSIATARLVLGNSVGDELLTFIQRWWRENDPEGDNYDYSDNFRLALVGDTLSEAEYTKAQDEGCCGSVDTVLGPLSSGHSFRWGFDYGH